MSNKFTEQIYTQFLVWSAMKDELTALQLHYACLAIHGEVLQIHGAGESERQPRSQKAAKMLERFKQQKGWQPNSRNKQSSFLSNLRNFISAVFISSLTYTSHMKKWANTIQFCLLREGYLIQVLTILTYSKIQLNNQSWRFKNIL